MLPEKMTDSECEVFETREERELQGLPSGLVWSSLRIESDPEGPRVHHGKDF